MIIGAHVILSSTDAGATRAFLQKLLGVKGVDAGRGWLILPLPPAEVAAHPADAESRHELYLMCDDIDHQVKTLQRKGVEFTGPVMDRGWGRITSFRVPGAGTMSLYQPQHPVAIKTANRQAKKKVVKKTPRPRPK